MWTNELPAKPGVYLWRLKEGEPVYVRQLSHGYRPNLVDVFTDDHQYAVNLRGQWCHVASVIDRIDAMEKRLEAVEAHSMPKVDHAKVSAILGSEIGGGNPNAPFGQRNVEPNPADVLLRCQVCGSTSKDRNIHEIGDNLRCSYCLEPAIPEKPATVEEWMKRHGKEPAKIPLGYGWLHPAYSEKNNINTLPDDVWDQITTSMEGSYKGYKTRESAIAALDAALRKCGELAESKVPSPGVVKAVENIVNNPSVLTEPAEDWPINPPSPLAALAEKWEKSYKAHAAAMEGQNEREFELHEAYAGTFRECAAELSAALAAVEPSEEEMYKGYDDAKDVSGDWYNFAAGVRWILAKIKGSK